MRVPFPGVLLQPYVRTLPEAPDEIVVLEDLPSGIAVAYRVGKRVRMSALNLPNERLAQQLARGIAARVRWQLDSPATRKERPA